MLTCTPTTDIRQVIEDLQDPAAYPHPVETVHVVQTHVSCVFLTGDYAYKVKKPVDFGFLDYSTLTKRRRFCRQELELNRRLCPDLYLDVVPITQQNGRLQVGGAGEPVEWAVKMLQLREAEMLPQRLQAGTVGPAQIERIAYTLADFHARAAGGEDLRAFGSPQRIAATIAGTLDVMDRVAQDTLSVAARVTLRSYLEMFECREAELLRQRMLRDRTRNCHGDLRLQNICLDARYDDGLQIFDCIEFNEEFRYIDVAADLAYLAMDLDLAGHADLRGSLVRTYRKASGDSDLLRILPYYQVYRACVRGNIALLAASEEEIAASERQVQREIAAAAYDLALCYACRRPGPGLLITAGFSGSGKSLLARELCHRLPAVLLSSDQVRKELAGVAATQSLGSEHYRQTQRTGVYAELRRRAGAYLQQGETVLLDATFLSAQERAAAADLAARHGAEFWLLECQCPDAVIRQRLCLRGQDANASDAGLAVYEAQIRSYRPMTLPALDGLKLARHLTVDTDQPIAEAAHQVVNRFLGSR